MSTVSSKSALRHRCTILRNTVTERDGLGHLAPPDMQEHLTDVLCRGWTTHGERHIQSSADVLTEQRWLIVPLGTDVTEQDQIADVTSRGTVVLDGPHRIDAILTYRDRLQLALTRIS